MLAVDTVEAQCPAGRRPADRGARRAPAPAAPALAGDVGRARTALAGKRERRAHRRDGRPQAGLSAALTPLGFPFVVPLRGGRLTIAAADFTPYWGVCLPTDAPDPQGLLGGLRHALRLPERGGGHVGPATACSRTGSSVTCVSIPMCPHWSSARSTPVAADQLADMLVELQRSKQLRHVSYDIRIFAPFDGTAGAGAARRWPA